MSAVASNALSALILQVRAMKRETRRDIASPLHDAYLQGHCVGLREVSALAMAVADLRRSREYLYQSVPNLSAVNADCARVEETEPQKA